MPLWTLLQLALMRLPTYTEFLLAFTVQVGSIAALLHLSRRSELTVLRASGMSVWQFLRPGLVVAFVLGVLAVTLYNPMAASSRTKAEQAYAEAFGQDSNLLNRASLAWRTLCFACCPHPWPANPQSAIPNPQSRPPRPLAGTRPSQTPVCGCLYPCRPRSICCLPIIPRGSKPSSRNAGNTPASAKSTTEPSPGRAGTATSAPLRDAGRDRPGITRIA